jgi:AsmA family
VKLSIRPTLLLLTVVAVLGVLLGVMVLALRGAASRSRLEQMASSALDMQVRIGGAVHVQLLAGPGVSAEDIHLQRDGAELASVRQANVAVSVLSLLRGSQRIAALRLRGVTLSLRQGADGRFNFQEPEELEKPRSEVQVGRIEVADGTLTYTTAGGETAARFEGCDLNLGAVHLSAAENRHVLQQLSARGDGSCRQIQTPNLQTTETRFSVTADAGKFLFAPVTLHAYGGQGSAELHADLTGKVPAYQLQYDLKKFRVEEWLRVFSPKKIAAGEMDFAARLSMQGRTLTALKQTSDGSLSLRGQNLALQIGDLDHDLSRYESTQQFNLVDLGAILLGGPAGVLVTKGYDYARVLHGPGGTSVISQLVSDWQVQHGIAHARDVAMTTAANRVAVQGDLDLVNGRFGDVTVAVLDDQGCARVQQKVHGRFGSPEIDKPNVLMALSGPARRLVTRAKSLLGGHCETFYSGSLAAPPPAEPRAGSAAILP